MGMFEKLLGWFKSLFSRQIQATTPVVPLTPPQPDYFQQAFSYVLPNEGGYSNRDDDRGGPTNFGITIATLSKWRKRICKPIEVKTMLIDEAMDIYHAWYWTDIGLHLIKNRAFAICLFDQGVLNGPHTAIMYAQLALNKLGSKLVVDGVLIPMPGKVGLTLAALEKVDTQQFLKAYHGFLKSHFEAIVARDHTQAVNLDGWMNRADRLLNI